MFTLQCNNPQTKEPKLQAAVRIVAEWTDYDQEIKRIYNKFLEGRERGTHSGEKHTQERKTGEHSLPSLTYNLCFSLVVHSLWSQAKIWNLLSLVLVSVSRINRKPSVDSESKTSIIGF